jgi:hypothetical protein
LQARYAFSGARAEMARTLPLAADEPVLLRGVMNLRGQGLLARPTVVRVTPSRLALLAHYVFQPDRVWDIPRTAVQEIELVQRTVRIVWASQQGGAAESRLAAWTNRPFLDRPLRDVGGVAELLQSWRNSPAGDLPERAIPHHHRR